MSSIKAKIVQQLDYLPDNALKQVSDFIDYLTWCKTADIESRSILVDKNASEQQDIGWLETDLSNLDEYEPYEWQAGEIEQGSSIEIDPQRGIVVVEK